MWERGEIICKVKEPQAEELPLMWDGQILFTYLHLAAYPEVGEGLLERRVMGIAYETVQLGDTGALPLLAPMSEVAGRMAPQIGAHYLEHHNGGRGVLFGGAPGVRPARVVVLGAGNVGWNAAWIAAGMEAEVWLLDRNLDRLRWVDQIHKGRILTLASNRGAVARAVANADLVVGAVLVPGGRAPVLVTEDMVANMRPRAVIVDCAIDQGGCVGDRPGDDPHRPRLRGPRRRPLLRGQCAWRRARDLYQGPDQRHPALPGGPGRGGPAAGRGSRSGPGCRLQHHGRTGGQPGGGRRPRLPGRPAP